MFPSLGTISSWVVIFILPINSALNPILYTLTTSFFREQVEVLLCHWQRRHTLKKDRKSLTSSTIFMETSRGLCYQPSVYLQQVSLISADPRYAWWCICRDTAFCKLLVLFYCFTPSLRTKRASTDFCLEIISSHCAVSSCCDIYKLWWQPQKHTPTPLNRWLSHHPIQATCWLYMCNEIWNETISIYSLTSFLPSS